MENFEDLELHELFILHDAYESIASSVHKSIDHGHTLDCKFYLGMQVRQDRSAAQNAGLTNVLIPAGLQCGPSSGDGQQGILPCASQSACLFAASFIDYHLGDSVS